MRSLVFLVALLGSTSLAAAESLDASSSSVDKEAYVALGAELGVQRAFMSGGYIDVGGQIGQSRAFARGRLTLGESGSGGSYQQMRFGIEGRACVARDWLCGFTGIDLGFQHDRVMGDGAQTTHMVYSDGHDGLAVPRVGFEVGRRIRARTALDLPLSMRLDTGRTRAGAALSLGLGYSF